MMARAVGSQISPFTERAFQSSQQLVKDLVKEQLEVFLHMFIFETPVGNHHRLLYDPAATVCMDWGSLLVTPITSWSITGVGRRSTGGTKYIVQMRCMYM